MSDTPLSISVNRAPAAANDALIRQQALEAAATRPAGTQSSQAIAQNAEVEAPEEPLTESEQQALTEAIQQVDELVKPLSMGLAVQRIDSINQMYVKLFDRETGETLREIPPRKILEMKENIRAFQGLLFDKTG